MVPKATSQRDVVMSSILDEIRHGNENAQTVTNAVDNLADKVDDHSERIAVVEAQVTERLGTFNDLKEGVQKLSDALNDLRVQVAVIGAVCGFIGAYIQAKVLAPGP